MIYKRVAARLKAQDWLAITIELTIVVIGVFIGTWVANWNQERAAQRDTRALLLELGPEMATQKHNVKATRDYCFATQRYADTAFAGWRRDPNVTDSQFVIAAYQASQAPGWTPTASPGQLFSAAISSAASRTRQSARRCSG